MIHSRLPCGGRTVSVKSIALASSAMLDSVSIEGEACSMSKRAKSSPADFISRRIAGLRTMLIQMPTCVSPRSSARFMALLCMVLSPPR